MPMKQHRNNAFFHSTILIVSISIVGYLFTTSQLCSKSFTRKYIQRSPLFPFISIRLGITPTTYLNILNSCVSDKYFTISRSQYSENNNYFQGNYANRFRYVLEHHDITSKADTISDISATFYNGTLQQLNGNVCKGLYNIFYKTFTELYGKHLVVKDSHSKDSYYMKWNISNGYVLFDYDTLTKSDYRSYSFTISTDSNYYSSHLISDSTLMFMDYLSLQYMIDDIYAQRGYIFSDYRSQRYQDEYWYRPTTEDDNIIFNKTETRNINKLNNEKKKALKHRNKYFQELVKLKQTLSKYELKSCKYDSLSIFKYNRKVPITCFDNTHSSIVDSSCIYSDKDAYMIFDILNKVHLDQNIYKNKIVTFSTALERNGFTYEYSIHFDMNSVDLVWKRKELNSDKEDTQVYKLRIINNMLCLVNF